METETLHGAILKALGVLEGKVDSGFTNTNQRLDTLNSKVATHEGRLNGMDVAEARKSARLDAVVSAQGAQSSVKAKWIDRGALMVITIILQLFFLLLIRIGIIDVNPIPPATPQEIEQRTIELRAEAEKLQATIDQARDTNKQTQ